jgi:hypothetical protein
MPAIAETPAETVNTATAKTSLTAERPATAGTPALLGTPAATVMSATATTPATVKGWPLNFTLINFSTGGHTVECFDICESDIGIISMSGTDNEMENVLFDIMFSDIGLKFPNLMLSRIFSNVGA